MVTLEQIRSDLEKKLEIDKDLHFVEVHADTLDEALADAAVQLDCRVAVLEYEVVEAGSNGFMGMMKKPWTIRANVNSSQIQKAKQSTEEDIFADDEFAVEEVNIDRDGLFYVHYFDDQINLKVVLPIGEGKPVALKEVMQKVKNSGTLSLDEAAIKKFVINGTGGVYEPVGQYQHNKAADAIFTVDIASDEMKACITATSPAIGGADISGDKIKRMLESYGVVAGISDEKIEEFVDMPVYGIPYTVAEAIQPINGRDAYIAYQFETDKTKLKIVENEAGQVNYKERNQIQNVVEGQPLAQKMLPERGKNGKTIFGRLLDAKNGKDIPLPLGKNVHVDSDGRTILASTNGQVMLINDKIHVEPVLEVDEVSIKTGNITFLGTVRVKRNVEDGFSIKASGNIEIGGAVGRCVLEADGNIVVNQGIMGRDEGFIKAGKSLWAKFIQNTKVEVEEYVVVQDAIMNSDITSNKKILLVGKNAKIIGGHLFATEEIHAKVIGSSGGGSETILEVGYDPRAKKRLLELQDKQASIVRELDNLDLDISTLENMKKVRKTLPGDKEENLIKLKKHHDEISIESEQMTEEIQQIQSHLRELKVIGKISVANTIYAGVKLFIRDVKEEIRSDEKAVTFVLENIFVRHNKYEPLSPEDAKRAPDGYSAS